MSYESRVIKCFVAIMHAKNEAGKIVEYHPKGYRLLLNIL